MLDGEGEKGGKEEGRMVVEVVVGGRSKGIGQDLTRR